MFVYHLNPESHIPYSFQRYEAPRNPRERCAQSGETRERQDVLRIWAKSASKVVAELKQQGHPEPEVAENPNAAHFKSLGSTKPQQLVPDPNGHSVDVVSIAPAMTIWRKSGTAASSAANVVLTRPARLRSFMIARATVGPKRPPTPM